MAAPGCAAEKRVPPDIVEQSIWTTTWEAGKAGAVTSGFMPFATSTRQDQGAVSLLRVKPGEPLHKRSRDVALLDKGGSSLHDRRAAFSPSYDRSVVL